MNFKRIAEGVGLIVLTEIDNGHRFWGYLPIRTSFEGSPHKEIVDIPLRGPQIYPDSTLTELQEEVCCVNYAAMAEFPIVHRLCTQLLCEVAGETLGRVVITKLPPGGKITPHPDEGEAAEKYDRFHICLQGDEGNVFIVDGEEQVMAPGEVWWLDNRKVHSVENRGKEDRIHIVIDIMRYKRGWS